MARWLCFLAIRHVEETFPHTHVVEGTGICFSLSLTQSRLPHMKQEGLEFLLLIFLLLHINNFTDMARYGYRIPQVKNHQLRFLLKRRRHVALGKTLKRAHSLVKNPGQEEKSIFAKKYCWRKILEEKSGMIRFGVHPTRARKNSDKPELQGKEPKTWPGKAFPVASLKNLESKWRGETEQR